MLGTKLDMIVEVTLELQVRMLGRVEVSQFMVIIKLVQNLNMVMKYIIRKQVML